ncbi:juvenile hormone esterase-like isoform X2 [Anticarsia gemmatalis]|uniref:juvenile hormone esterase-like isoform X2 n=1 Tax=Anticarsia gemmatalis TaxID=129554 RepID=UPI003F77058A
MAFTSAIVVLLSLLVNNVIGDEVLVQVEQGWLSGEKVSLVTGDGTYNSFKGIPYAQPPVGKLRFLAPQLPLPWEGTRNATAHGAVCPQVDIFTNVFTPGSEDCLFLNVYTPNITTDLLPVMVYIHGGGYKCGSGNIDNLGPDFLVAKGVVVVTINYRLDALGFLCMDTAEVPGNAGLKDQLAAIKWVKKNIDKFGGSPSNITIFGQSAGAASVAYHTISPLSKGYFQRAIVMSGSPYSDWTLPYKPAKRAFILGEILGFETNNTTELLNFLQNVTFEKLVNVSATVLASEEVTNILIKLYPFTPVYEKDFGQEIFLSEEPITILKSGDVNYVDLLFGYTSLEAQLIVTKFKESLLALYNRYAEMLVPSKIVLKSNADTVLYVSDKIHEYFFGNQSIGENTMREMVYYASNATFVYDLHRFFRDFPNPGNNSRYFYKFSSYSARNSLGVAGNEYGLFGAAHTEDLLYLFDPKALNLTLDINSTEYKLIDQAATLFTNFAKYGNPTPDSSLGTIWPQFDNETLSYVDIGSTLTASTAPDEPHMKFWSYILSLAGIDF